MNYVLNAAKRLLLADEEIIAPSTSFKPKNEADLHHEQQNRDTKNPDSTEVKNSRKGLIDK